MGKVINDLEEIAVLKNLRDMTCRNDTTDKEIVDCIENFLPDEIEVRITKGGRDAISRARMFYFDSVSNKKYAIGNYKGPYSFEPIVFESTIGLSGIALELSDYISKSVPFCFFNGKYQAVFYIDICSKKIIKQNDCSKLNPK